MKKTDRKKLAEEWNEILKNHLDFAKTFLAQQAILMEASELGHKIVDRGMKKILEAGLPLLFEDYWVLKSSEISKEAPVSKIIECLSHQNRDPARCFGNDDPEGWFDDPFKDGQTLPPLPPPDPHIR